jgi:hypothetical protein
MKIILNIIAYIINKLAESKNITAIQETKLYRINEIIYDEILNEE